MDIIIGTLFVVLMVALAIWQIISKWRVYKLLEREGSTLYAQVTDIKQETRLVTQLGDVASTNQGLLYENFLYAQCNDPLSQNTYTFRIKIPNTDQFHIGETISIRMNRSNPNEYQIVYSKLGIFPRKAVPKIGNADYISDLGDQISNEETKPQSEIVIETHVPEESKRLDP